MNLSCICWVYVSLQSKTTFPRVLHGSPAPLSSQFSQWAAPGCGPRLGVYTFGFPLLRPPSALRSFHCRVSPSAHSRLQLSGKFPLGKNPEPPQKRTKPPERLSCTSPGESRTTDTSYTCAKPAFNLLEDDKKCFLEEMLF